MAPFFMLPTVENSIAMTHLCTNKKQAQKE